ncbi:RNA polymerase sigma factor [Changchengzhania lutea]|uniref:RNA polymerase sigma factor n=1 Tax=Changchengzhania lutea TaxID=2049305 RepID=UPI00115C9DE3|nr:RNA polymerase sigma factor [Changchengzhania lutea]
MNYLSLRTIRESPTNTLYNKLKDNYEDSIEYEIIEGCKLEKSEYQEKLYKHFYGYAFSISRLNTYSREEAVDVMNDSFIKVFSNIHRFDLKQSFKAWIRRIIINTAIDNYRKNKKHYFLLDVVEVDPPEVNESVISKLTAEDILKLLDQLPKPHRLVFNLYEIQGFNHKEIAEKLNIKISSSRTFLTRAKNKLRILLNENFKN